ncbi:MAG: hypothetical protein K0R57_4203 [Paenibacillaceae bacterium]|jgi:hypothetical protein|nr:hypothetical protein [Paenibacillaceae bacterium]
MGDFFLCFVLAHAIGDFVLQTDRIAYLKSRHVRGVALHSVIVAAVQLAAMAVFGWAAVAAACAVSLLHFAIDCLKLACNKHFTHTQSLYFLLDQAAHLGCIGLAALLLAPEPVFGADMTAYVSTLIALIIVSYVASVFAKIVVRDLFRELRTGPFFAKYERPTDMVSGLLFYTGCSLRPSLGLPMVIALAAAYCLIQRRAWQYPYSAALVKLALLAVAGFLAASWA